MPHAHLFQHVSANSNLDLIHCIRDELARVGVKCRLSYNAERTKANLFATLGEGKPAGIILSGHTDTVPWDGQDWSVDPLGAVVRDGRLYGRGSADMKGFIAPPFRMPSGFSRARRRSPSTSPSATTRRSAASA